MAETKKGNTNCLQGFECPRCHSEGPFDIEATALFLAVTDDGTNEYEEVEWLSHNFCRCTECGFEGKVFDFEEE